ncbi:MAG TPA: DUF1501 domain-containing protein [Verrucomicrobiales bacterium]|nr:DUF1501 domain-containing protein [Verrucomicrobiales bacterium]
MNAALRSLDPLTRRTFAQQVASAALGVTLLPHLQGASTENPSAPSKTLPGFGKAKNVIWLQMLGGMSHIDTLDPKTGDTKGPRDPITTKAGYQLGGYLPTLAKEHSDKLAIIRSMSTKVGTHLVGQYFCRTGYDQKVTIRHPTLGAWGHHLLGKKGTLPASVCINRSPDYGHGFFSPLFAPLPIYDPETGLQFSDLDTTPEIMTKRLALLNDVDAGFRAKFQDTNLKAYTDFYDNTVKLLGSEDLKAFQLTEEDAATRKKYGTDSLGQGCLLARRLVERGVRFVEVARSAWDMHVDIDARMGLLGGMLDNALSALLSDLQARGLLDSTLVVLCTEMGRTPLPNSNGGRDHHPKAFSILLAGGPAKGGTIYGASDKDGAVVTTPPTSFPDLHKTVGHAMGMDVDEVVLSPSGRPFTVGDKGSVITDVLT